MVGPLRIHFQDRWCDLSALVFGDEPLLGAVPMEMMDLVIEPGAQRLTINLHRARLRVDRALPEAVDRRTACRSLLQPD